MNHLMLVFIIIITHMTSQPPCTHTLSDWCQLLPWMLLPYRM